MTTPETELFKRVKVHTVYKTSGGIKVPGVTTVLGELAKPALVPWAWKLGSQGIELKDYVDVLAGVGELAHMMILCHLKGKEPDLSEFSPKQVDLAENCLLSYFEWERQHKLEPFALETPVVDDELEFGGTADFYGTVDDVFTLIDFKTGKGIYPDYFYQLAAYKHLAEKAWGPVEVCRILNIGRAEDEEFREAQRKDLDAEWEVFYHTLMIYKAKRRIKDGGK